MQHRIPTEALGATGPGMARAVATCVHCGFCLPTCPTYRVLGEEMDSPRGRIVLMRQVLEGELAAEEAQPHIDRCLGCLACVSACPSGVKYEELLVPYRARTDATVRGAAARARRALLLSTLESPARFRLAAAAGRLARAASGLLPSRLRGMIALLPARLPPPVALPAVTPARGTRRARVALLAGCVQQALAPRINEATIRVLAAAGVDVVVPQGQGCCGALAVHAGLADRGRALASRNLAAFPGDVDAVVTNAAGCGSVMKEYGMLFAGEAGAAAAEAFAGRVRDVSELLDDLGFAPPPLPAPMTVAYHDACHLAHAQGVRSAPRRLLAAVPNLTVREIADAEICCGSAGLYNLEQPEIAADLGARKARAVHDTGAEAVVSGNLGCLTQIASHLERLGSPLPARHTIEVLDAALGAP